MFSSFKVIAVVVDETQRDNNVADHAARLAKRHGAHLIAIYSAANPEVSLSGSYAVGKEAIGDVLTHMRSEHDSKVLKAETFLAELSHRYDLSVEFRLIWRQGDDLDLTAHALHCDLLILAHPMPERVSSLRPDQLLLNAGTPVLIVPAQWEGARIGSRTVIAWNGSRQARRGIVDAMPFLARSEWVKVLLVDADRHPEKHGPYPGTDMAHYLARHDVEAVEVERIEAGDQSVAEAILSFTADQDADLLVIGAYSHPLLFEMLLGGVTRPLLTDTTVPLLIAL
ncbi:universal stress protein [Altererythrobacter sp. H2]|uniref:universal stress protein n=1 Tax=Erythrobacteraceae TaxID=335929 RepID=UPI0004524332|nr:MULTISPECIES: universal stress protein [Erythrobacteraceae]EZP66675.1 hypothetical protein BV96_04502 [Sphingomonas paucimobilis]WRK95814.1 universal stress protein [Altererythrobacter sp. H2]